MKGQVLHLMELHFFMEGVFDTPTSKTYFKHTFPKEMQLHQMQSQVYYKQERIYAPDTNDFLEYRNWEEISQFIEQANNYHASKV